MARTTPKPAKPNGNGTGAVTRPGGLKTTKKSSPGYGGAREGAGRTSKAAMLGLKELLDKCWTPEDREACVRALARSAKAGEMEAVKLLFGYAFGKPKDLKEHSGAILVNVAYVERSIHSEADG